MPSQQWRKIHKPLIDKCLSGEEAEFTEYYTLPSGEGIHAHGKYKPIKNESGQVISFVVYVDDISKLKQAENELKEINATKDKLLSIISHDLKSPIRSLQGLLSISSDISPLEFQQTTSKIERQVQVVSFTMDNLLTWVKSQLKGFKLNLQSIDMTYLVKSCLELYRSEIDAKKIIVDNDMHQPQWVRADADHVKLVLRNILSNALKFTPEGGEISIASSVADNQLEIIFKDTGIGIAPKKLHGLLSPQVHSSSEGTAGEQGTGLGLALCVDVLELNHGKLDIKSRTGQGTRVHLFLPLADS